MPALASSHREAPNITEMPKVDNTDVYAFRSYEPGRSGYVTLISNFQPLQEPGGGPNYFTMDPNAVYEIHVDNNGDAVEDLTYQFKFQNTLKDGTGIKIDAGGKLQPIPLRHIGQVTVPNDPELNERESYTVKQISGDRRQGTAVAVGNATSGGSSFMKPFDNAGNKSIPNYPAYADQFIYNIAIPGCSGGGRVFVGQREEAFAVNLGPIFDLVNFVPIEGDNDPVYGNGQPFAGGITQSDANQELVNAYNITSIAIELPIACVTGTGNGVIGVWSSASLPQSRLLKPNPTYAAPDTQGGSLVQVSRLGMPLVNEVVIGLPQKDLFNAAKPTQDGALASYVTNPSFPEILQVLFGVQAPNNFPRNDLVAAFLTGFTSVNKLQTVTPSEMQRLNTAINPTPQASQKTLGLVADDLAGFPNGRRPGDDVVDIVLRVAMGRLCYPIPINGTPTSLGLCQPADAPSGNLAYTDGAPTNANTIMNRFPYLNPALRGSPRPQTTP
ncbi:MAG: DUF4331 domain-containing protein [Sphingomicrobium sp.]